MGFADIVNGVIRLHIICTVKLGEKVEVQKVIDKKEDILDAQECAMEYVAKHKTPKGNCVCIYTKYEDHESCRLYDKDEQGNVIGGYRDGSDVVF